MKPLPTKLLQIGVLVSLLATAGCRDEDQHGYSPGPSRPSSGLAMNADIFYDGDNVSIVADLTRYPSGSDVSLTAGEALIAFNGQPYKFMSNAAWDFTADFS